MNLVPQKFTKVHGDRILNIFLLNGEIITTSKDGTIRVWDDSMVQKKVYFNDLNLDIVNSWIGEDNSLNIHYSNGRFESWDTQKDELILNLKEKDLIFYDGKKFFFSSDKILKIKRGDNINLIELEVVCAIMSFKIFDRRRFFVQNDKIFEIVDNLKIIKIFKGKQKIKDYFIFQDLIFIIYDEISEFYDHDTLKNTLNFTPTNIIKKESIYYMNNNECIISFDGNNMKELYIHDFNIINFIFNEEILYFYDEYQPNLLRIVNKNGTLKSQKHEGRMIKIISMNDNYIMVHYPASLHQKIGSKLNDYFEIIQMNGKIISKWKIERRKGFKEFNIIKDVLIEEKGFYFDYKSDLNVIWMDSFNLLIWSESDTAKMINMYGDITHDYNIFISNAISSDLLYISHQNLLYTYSGKNLMNSLKFKSKIERILVNEGNIYLLHENKISIVHKNEIIEIEKYDEILNIFYKFTNLIYITKTEIIENKEKKKNIWREPIPVYDFLKFNYKIEYVEKREEKDYKELIVFGKNSFGIYLLKPSNISSFIKDNIKYFIIKEERTNNERKKKFQK